MNDDKDRKNKGPRRGAGGPRADGKPFRKREEGGDKRFAKPFRKREEGEARAERPNRDFRRDDRPSGDGERKPFRKPYEKSASGEGRPFRKREEGDRPFRRREDERGEARAERPKREFRRDDRPSGDGERKPFRKNFDRDPAGGGDRPFRKPFQKREGGEFRRDGERPPRPGRTEREQGRGAPRAREDRRPEGGEDTESERIARRLARAGVASRRDAESLIAAGRIRVNGKVIDTPALNVKRSDRIELDGKEIPAIERTRLFLFHKPAGVVTTNRDPEGRKTVFDILPEQLPRLMTVGRLDINTEGLLLLTNDGGLARMLELPATGWLRRYRVRVHGKVEPEALTALKDGIAVDGVFYGAVEATLDREQGSNAWLTIGLREGKNREVKNILSALGLDVTRLIRISYGPFQLGELAEGEVRELKGRMLRDQLGERLIEEAGADFDAPVINEFSNKPVAREEKPREERGERPNRKREREQKREDALDRLQTRPQRGPKRGFDDKPKRFGGDKRDERASSEQRPRKSNVWMAPGARPVGEKKAAALAERRYAGKPRPGGKGGGKPAPRGGPRKPRGEG